MARALFFLINDKIRATVRALIDKAPPDSRVEIRPPKRTLDQNSLLWAMLTDVSRQQTHFGRTYSPEVWKSLFLHNVGQQSEYVPALDGSTVIPLGYRSSEMSIEEMSDLIEAIAAYGAEHGVEFHRPGEKAA
jgi:hypothetical protein